MSTVLIAVIALLALVGLVVAGLVLFAAFITRAVEKAVPPLGQFIDMEGARIHYLDRGRGPTILLIHGLTGQMRNFTHSLVDLLTDEFRVIAFDRPGSGYSTRAPGASAGLTAQGGLIVKFMHAIGLERPLVVGHSLGGAISLAIALDHPECACGFALISSLTAPQERAPTPFRALVIQSSWRRKIVAWTIAIPVAIRRGQETLAIVFGPDKPPADFATKGGGLLGLRPKNFIGGSEDVIGAAVDLPKMVERYPSLTVPIAILFGTDDGVLDYQSNGTMMQKRIPGLTLELVPGGHMLPVTAPKETAAFIKAAARKFASSEARPSVA
jgi:pimeloyl-ACP methyl ester carboxylesterase